MKQRSVGIAILLSIITCGIYGIYWLIMLNDETNYVSGHQQDGTSGGVVFLLTHTCNLRYLRLLLVLQAGRKAQ